MSTHQGKLDTPPTGAGGGRGWTLGLLAAWIALGGTLLLLLAEESRSSRAQRDHRLARFLERELQQIWHDDAARRALVARAGSALGLTLQLSDTDGSPLEAVGRGCAVGAKAMVLRPRVGGASPARVVVCDSHTGLPLAGVPRWIPGAVWSLLAGLLVLALARAARARSRLRSWLNLSHREDVVTFRNRLVERGRGSGLEHSLLHFIDCHCDQEAGRQRLFAETATALRTSVAHFRVLLERLHDDDCQPKKLSEAFAHELEEIDDAVDRINVDSLLEKNEFRSFALDPEQIALSAVQRTGLDASHLHIRGQTGAVLADPMLFRRAITTLLRRAEEHGGGLDRLKIWRAGNDVVFAVYDRSTSPTSERPLDETKPNSAAPVASDDDQAESNDSAELTSALVDATAGGLDWDLDLSLVTRIANAHKGRLEEGHSRGKHFIALRVPAAKSRSKSRGGKPAKTVSQHAVAPPSTS